MTFNERLELCERFHEGCETTDAVERLLSAARILYGLSDKHHAELALINAEDIIRRYVEWAKVDADWDQYHEIDDRIFAYFGGHEKLSELAWMDQNESDIED